MYDKGIFDQVILLRKTGKSMLDISKITNLPKSTIQKMVSPTHIKKQNHPGRPAILNKSFKKKNIKDFESNL